MTRTAQQHRAGWAAIAGGIAIVLMLGASELVRRRAASSVLSLETADVILDLGNGTQLGLVQLPEGRLELAGDVFRTAIDVAVPAGTFIGTHEVTEEQWDAVMPDPEAPASWRQGPMHPVQFVEFDEADLFVRRLSDRFPQWEFSIPDEAIWEYACRAGSRSTWCFGDDENEVGQYAWFRGNSGGSPAPDSKHEESADGRHETVLYGARVQRVGLKLPNGWGIYDMHGNVAEWCIPNGVFQRNGLPMKLRMLAEPSGAPGVVRGGTYTDRAMGVVASSRGFHDEGLPVAATGLRVTARRRRASTSSSK